MVNVGGRSKGCRTCIKRKIRCDRQRPVCSQCQKSNRQCAGYRSDAELIFRNMFQDGPPPQPRNEADDDTKQLDSNLPPDPTIYSLNLNEESGLITFFSNNFLCDRFRPGTSLIWVPDHFFTMLQHPHARTSILGVSAIALARLQRSSYYEREGQKYHGSALLNLASTFKQDGTEIDTDTVLFSVLFLAFFEIIACFESSNESWTTHVEALGTLMTRRQDIFLRTDLGARMLLMSRAQAIVGALQAKRPVQMLFQQPSRLLSPSTPQAVVVSDRCDSLLIRLAALQFEVRSQGSSVALMERLAGLDEALGQLIQNAPRVASHFMELRVDDDDLWWERRRDIYPSAVVAHVWSKIRAARIVTQDLMYQVSADLSSRNVEFADHNTITGESRTCLSPEIRALVTDICATVDPYYRPPSTLLQGSGEEPSPPPIGTAYWLLWPLEVVGSVQRAPPQLRDWVVQCLERIFVTTGVVKAQVAADRLQALVQGSIGENTAS